MGKGGRDKVWDQETMFSQLEIVGETKRQPCLILTNNNMLDHFIGYIVFTGRGQHYADKNYWKK